MKQSPRWGRELSSLEGLIVAYFYPRSMGALKNVPLICSEEQAVLIYPSVEKVCRSIISSSKGTEVTKFPQVLGEMTKAGREDGHLILVALPPVHILSHIPLKVLF